MRMNTCAILLAIGVLCAAATPGLAEPPAEMDGMPLVFHDDFEGDLAKWNFTDEKPWEIAEYDASYEKGETNAGGKVLALTGKSRYQPPVRSPHSIAWTNDLDVTDFVLDVDARQTGKEYGHRDLCFFFGRQNASHFYYVHLATKADDHANSIFLVNGEPRVSIAAERTDGTDWGSQWQKIRIKRDTQRGSIEVYFNDMETPVMRAEDKHFASGPIGVGTFDDQGRFDNVTVWGKRNKAGADGSAAGSEEKAEGSGSK